MTNTSRKRTRDELIDEIQCLLFEIEARERGASRLTAHGISSPYLARLRARYHQVRAELLALCEPWGPQVSGSIDDHLKLADQCNGELAQLEGVAE